MDTLTLADLASFLLWCLVLNYGVLLVWFAAFSLAHDLVYRLHSRWFTIAPEAFDRLHYAAMAGYKVLVLVFNLVPWIALKILAP